MTHNDRLIDLAAETRDSIRHSVDMLRRLDHASELTTSQLATLSALHDGPVPMSLLAELKGVAQPTMSQHISRLENWGHVRRAPAPNDRRIVLVELTEYGREVAAKSNHARNEVVATALSRLSEEQHDALHQGIQTLRELAAQLLRTDHVEEAPAEVEVPADDLCLAAEANALDEEDKAAAAE